jgi:hypothetical protein
MSSVADTTPNGAPNNFQFLGRAEHTRVLTAKTRFCHTYEGSVREREPGDFSSISPKVAATYSPTIFRSAVPSAMLSLSAAPLPSARPSAPPPPHVSDLSPSQSHCLYLGSELNKVFGPPHVCFYNICLNLYILGSHLNILLGPFFIWEILHISYPPVL